MGSPGYRVETWHNGQWVQVVQESLAYCHGFLDARKDTLGPRAGYRVVRVYTGAVVRELPEQLEAGLGMIAGHPTPAQYREAAARCQNAALALDQRMVADLVRRSGGFVHPSQPGAPKVGDLVVVLLENPEDHVDPPGNTWHVGRLYTVEHVDPADHTLPWGLAEGPWVHAVRRPTEAELAAWALQVPGAPWG